MKRQIEFHEFARDEYIAAARWYDERQPGLGHELVADSMYVCSGAWEKAPGLLVGQASGRPLRRIAERLKTGRPRPSR